MWDTRALYIIEICMFGRIAGAIRDITFVGHINFIRLFDCGKFNGEDSSFFSGTAAAYGTVV